MFFPALCTITIILANAHQTVNGSGVDKRREIGSEISESGRWKEAINMKTKRGKEEKEVLMIVPEIEVGLKVQMKKAMMVNERIYEMQVKNKNQGMKSPAKKRLTKRETTDDSDAIDDAITKATKTATDSLKKVPSGSELQETFNPQLTSLLGEVNDRKEIKSLIDVVRFPDEAIDRAVDGIRTGIDSIIPEEVKKLRQETEAKAVEVLQPIVLSASRLFNLDSSPPDQAADIVVDVENDSGSKETPSFISILSPPKRTNKPSDSGLFHVFRGVLG